MPRAALSCAYAGKRPSVRTEAPDEAKPRPSAQQGLSYILLCGGNSIDLRYMLYCGPGYWAV